MRKRVPRFMVQGRGNTRKILDAMNFSLSRRKERGATRRILSLSLSLTSTTRASGKHEEREGSAPLLRAAVTAVTMRLRVSLSHCSNGSGDGLHGNWSQRGVQEWHGIVHRLHPRRSTLTFAQLTATLDPRAAQGLRCVGIDAAGSR